MFLNIREEDIRADCPHNAPMTLRAFNKISPREFNTSVSPLNPFEIPRYAPKTVGQFSKALVQQQSGVVNQLTNALSIAAVEEAILAETDPEDFIMDVGLEEEKSGFYIDEDFRPQPAGELSMQEIDTQIQVLKLTLLDENISGEELEAATEMLGYYQQLRGEQVETEPTSLADDVIIQAEEKEEPLQKKVKIKVRRPRRTNKQIKEDRASMGEAFEQMKASSGLRGATQDLGEIRDPNVDLSDEMRLRALEMEKGIDYGGGGGVYGE